MPLSEHEQRILAEIEARLREDDPRFADAVGTRTVSTHLRGRLKLAAAGFLIGFVLLFVGLQVHLLWGVLGFGLMLASAFIALTLAKRMTRTRPAREAAAPSGGLQRYFEGARRREDDDS